jgi:myosin heavy subunit
MACPGLDDKLNFRKIIEAFEVLGFSQETIDSLMKMLSGILRIGNIEFEGTDKVFHKVKVRIYCDS